MDPHLSMLQREINASLSGFSPDQLALRPPGKWCASEILEHLFLSYTGTTRGMTRVLKADTFPSTAITFKNRVQSFIVIRLGYLPTGREAPSNVRPQGVSPLKVRAEVDAKLAEMDDALSVCAAKFGPHIKLLAHPFLGPLSVNQWRKFHLVHGRHHVKQIHQLQRSLRAV